MSDLSPTNQKIAYGIFKNIRNRIRKVKGDELLEALLTLLNHPDATSDERLPFYEVWHLLLLVKWCVIHRTASTYRQLKSATDYEVNELMNRTKQLGDYVSSLNTVQEAELFMRSSSYQQFWLQRRESIPMSFGRQLLLFGDLHPSHPHNEAFHAIMKLSISDFIEMSYCIFLLSVHRCTTNSKRLFVTADDFSSPEVSFTRDKVIRFLNSISASADDLRTYLDDHSQYYGNIAEEYFEQSPFMRYPLIRIQNRYYVVADILLQTSLSTFVADVLRAHDAQWFMREFGPMFESYVMDALSSTGLKFITEDELKQLFREKEGQKYVDFLLSDEGCNIYVEAKGVALRWDVMVTDMPDRIAKRVETSIEKGIRQAYNLAANLQPGTTIGGLEVGSGENYMLIVTFKDTYLGNARHYYDHIDSDAINEIIASHGKGELIPLEHILFVSVDELEILLGQIIHGSKTISELMASAVELGKIMKRVPPFRTLVTRDKGDIKITPLLQQASDELFQRMIANLDLVK